MRKLIEGGYALITLQGVRDLLASGKPFRCEYKLVGTSGDGKPRYNAIYVHGGQEFLFVATKFDGAGPKARELNLWPGLYLHHRQYGDGSSLVLHPDDTMETRKANEND